MQSHVSSNRQTMTFVERQQAFRVLIKEGIIKANLIPAFAAGFLAVMYYGHSFFSSLPLLLIMLLGVGLLIGGVAALNNYYDRDIDSVMKSKKQRPSIDGTYSGKDILWIGFSMVVTGEALLYSINMTAGTLGLLAGFGYVVLYSIYSKRHYVSNTIVGALPGAAPPLIGWAVIDPNLHILAIAMFFVMFIWQPPHFYALAINRKDEYSMANIPMLPSVKGEKRTVKSIVMWISLLVITPFFMADLGIWFVILITLLNLSWLVLSLNMFKPITDYKRYAKTVFVFSLNYILIFYVMIIVAGLLI